MTMTVTEAVIYNPTLMSAFAGKQTFRMLNSNVRLILKADVQVKVKLDSYRPEADSQPFVSWLRK